MSDARNGARARALRAACVVTLGLAGGCASSHRAGEPDAEVPPPDAAVETDAGPVADAGCPAWTYDDPPRTRQCCEEVGFWWEREQCIVAVPGPFVPPAMA